MQCPRWQPARPLEAVVGSLTAPRRSHPLPPSLAPMATFCPLGSHSGARRGGMGESGPLGGPWVSMPSSSGTLDLGSRVAVRGRRRTGDSYGGAKSHF